MWSSCLWGNKIYIQQYKQIVLHVSGLYLKIHGYYCPLPKFKHQKFCKFHISINYSVHILHLDIHGQTVLCVVCGCRVNHPLKHLLSASMSDKLRFCPGFDKHGPEQHNLNTALLSFRITNVSILQCWTTCCMIYI